MTTRQTATRLRLIASSARHVALAVVLGSAAAPAAWAQAAAPAAAASAPVDAMRPAVALPLQPVAGLLREGKAQEALARIAEAEAVGNLTPYEAMLIHRVRAEAAQVAKDDALLSRSLESALGTGKVLPQDELNIVEVLISAATRTRDYPRLIRWTGRYLELGGSNDAVRLLRIQAQMNGGQEADALKTLNERIAADEAAGRATPEQQLRWLLFLQGKVPNAGGRPALERLAAAYPRPEYWQNLLADAVNRAGNNDRIVIELYRLLRVTGNLTRGPSRDALAQMSMLAGQPAEAQTVVEEGFAAGALGTGPDAAAHQKLRENARKQAALDAADRPAAEKSARAAKEGTALVELGWSLVAALPSGTAGGAVAEQGVALIEEGIAKGGLRRPAEARLHLGIAQLAAGRKDAARQTLTALAAGTPATDPLADPIRLWALWSGAPAMLPAAR